MTFILLAGIKAGDEDAGCAFSKSAALPPITVRYCIQSKDICTLKARTLPTTIYIHATEASTLLRRQMASGTGAMQSTACSST